MEKYVVTFKKTVCKEVEADSREAATEAALDLINNGDRVIYDEEDVDYIAEEPPADD